MRCRIPAERVGLSRSNTAAQEAPAMLGELTMVQLLPAHSSMRAANAKGLYL